MDNSLDSRVYSFLSESILSGKFSPGDIITELGISKELGVSRTPVRDAFHLLERDGLVTLIPSKGAQVNGISRADLCDAYKIRMRLEGLAAGEAAKNMTPEALKKLSDNLDLTEFYISRNDYDKVKNLDSEFHELIYMACGSRTLCRILTELHRNVRIFRRMSLETPGRLEKSVAEHRYIYSAIAAGNADAADKASAEHVSNALENLLKLN